MVLILKHFAESKYMLKNSQKKVRIEELMIQELQKQERSAR